MKHSIRQAEELFDSAVCANEMTGALQQVSVDEQTILLYHQLYNRF